MSVKRDLFMDYLKSDGDAYSYLSKVAKKRRKHMREVSREIEARSRYRYFKE